MGQSGTEIPHLFSSSLQDLNPSLTIFITSLLVVGQFIIVTCIHSIEKKFDHAPHFRSVISRLYKEMMILGFISFTVMILEKGANIGHSHTLVAFEFGHIFIFVGAMTFFFQAILLFYLTSILCSYWDSWEVLQLDHILTQYRIHRHSFRLKYLISSLLQSMEYKIIRDMFLQIHQLPLKFDFAAYLEASVNSYIVHHVVHVRLSSWFIFMLFMDMDALVQHFIPLQNNHASLQFFCFVGFFLWCFSILILLSLEKSHRLLLKKSGCTDVTSLYKALEGIDADEEQSEIVSESNSSRFSSISKIGLNGEESNPEGELHFDLRGDFKLKPKNDTKTKRKLSMSFFRPQKDSIAPARVANYLVASECIISGKSEHDSPSIETGDDRFLHASKEGAKQAIRQLLRRRSSTSSFVSQPRSQEKSNVANVFIFGRPDWQVNVADWNVFVCSFYLAFFLVYFTFTTTFSQDPIAYFLCIFFPLSVILFISPVITYRIAILLSVAQVDKDILSHVVEAYYETRKARSSVREQLLLVIQQINLGRNSVEALYWNFCRKGDKILRAKDFRHHLRVLEIMMSNSTYDLLHRSMKTNSRGCIEYKEFIHLIYPEEVEAQCKQALQIKKKKQRG